MKKRNMLPVILISCFLAMALCACIRENDAGMETAQTASESIPETDAGQAEAEATAETQTDRGQTDEVQTDGEPAAETPAASVLEGEFVGWADNHTVEVIVNGVSTAFQVEDEGVKAALESYDEGTVFSFETKEEGGMRKITGLLQG